MSFYQYIEAIQTDPIDLGTDKAHRAVYSMNFDASHNRSGDILPEIAKRLEDNGLVVIHTDAIEGTLFYGLAKTIPTPDKTYVELISNGGVNLLAHHGSTYDDIKYIDNSRFQVIVRDLDGDLAVQKLFDIRNCLEPVINTELLVGSGALPIESILDNITIYGDAKAGDKELGGSGGLNGVRWGQLSYTEYVQGIDLNRLLWIPNFGDGIAAWESDGVNKFWETEAPVTESTFVEWILFRNADTAAAAILQESGPHVITDDGRGVALTGATDTVSLRIRRGGILSDRNEAGVTAAFDGNWVLLRREFAAPGNNSDNIAFINNVPMTLATTSAGNPGIGTESVINYLGMRAGLQFPFNGHYRVHLKSSPFPPAEQIPLVEAQINLEYGL